MRSSLFCALLAAVIGSFSLGCNSPDTEERPGISPAVLRQCLIASKDVMVFVESNNYGSVTYALNGVETTERFHPGGPSWYVGFNGPGSFNLRVFANVPNADPGIPCLSVKVYVQGKLLVENTKSGPTASYAGIQQLIQL